MLAEDVVPVQKVGSSYLVWDVDHVRTLREKYRIIGNLAGPFRAHKQQNDQLGLPLQISDNEAAVLLGMPEAVVLQNCEPVPIEKFLCPVLPSRHLAHKEEEKMRYVPKNIVSALRRNFYITSGLKFGCHFLLYPGDPLRYHASHMFIYLPRHQRLTAKEMTAYCRLANHVRKTVMIAMSFPPRFGVHQLASAAFMPAYGAVPVVPVLPTAAHYLMPTLSSPSIIPPQPPKGIPPQALTPQMVKRQEILMERPPVTTVFVGNIHERVSNDLIKAMLMKCGNIMNWKRIQGPSGKYQAFGFCEYDHPDSTLRALRLLHDWPLGDKKLVLKCDEKNKKTLIEFINKRRELYGKPPLVLEGDQLPADDEMKKEDEQFRKALQQLVVEMAGDLCSSVSNGSYGQKSPTLSGKGGNLDIESLDRDRKEYIAKEIIQFREAHKEEKESRPKSGTNDVDRKSASPSGEDQITSSKRPRERSRSHHSARSGSSESRQSAKKSRRRDESRDSSLDRRKIAARQRLSEADEDDAYERRRVERRIREKEAAFRERLAKWENREQRKAAERQEKAAKLAQLAAVEGHDRQVLRLFLEDYDDSKSDEQFYRGKALEIRLKDYREEAERDARDRQKEKEELEQLRKEIANGKNGKENAGNVSSGGGWRPVCTPAGETIRSESAPAKGGDKASIEKVITSTVSGTVNFSLASSSSGNQPMGFAGLKLGAPTTAAATNAPSVKPHFFAEDETQEEPPARKLVPLEYTEEERRALIDAPYSGVQLTAEEKRRVAKVIIEKIPTSKEELFAQEILWDYVDSYVIEKRIRPWVGKKIVEYIGEEEVSLVDFICQKVKQKAKPQEILDDISMVLDEEATVFVVKLWRLLIYEIEAKRQGVTTKPDGQA
ncbi:putative tRNA intron endonuclease [Trichuris suis]|nr:putative tRNA intron endonuclease [Trichuris suis]